MGSAITPDPKVATEFGGEYKIVCGTASPAAPDDTITFAEFAVVKSFVATWVEPTTANCAIITHTKATNVVTLALIKADGSTTADTAYPNFDFVAIGTPAVNT